LNPSLLVKTLSIAKIFGLNYILPTFDVVVPDLAEMLARKVQHRGVTHSLALWLGALVLGWMTGITLLRDALTGVVFGHLLMDALMIMVDFITALDDIKEILFDKCIGFCLNSQ